jgi:hypothetical protein
VRAVLRDFRDPELVEFTSEELLKQRIFALCLGYEDLNDHDTLRSDPLLATLVGRADPTGEDRIAAIADSRWPARARSIVWN